MWERGVWNEKHYRKLNQSLPSGIKQWKPKKLSIMKREVEECYNLTTTNINYPLKAGRVCAFMSSWTSPMTIRKDY